VNDRHQARLAVLAAVALYLGLPPKLTFGPIWIVPLIVALLLTPIVAMTPMKLRTMRLMRALTFALIAALNFFNIASVVLLISDLLSTHKGHVDLTARELIQYGAQIWMTNVIVFALWFWELDGDGPFARQRYASASDVPLPDFLFPQMSIDRSRVPGLPADWKPKFLDYLYVSFTNALAISPTDTMPLSRIAKMLMLSESLISFVTVALILARSVNILS
jgi:uncharacterized membrane protein